VGVKRIVLRMKCCHIGINIQVSQEHLPMAEKFESVIPEFKKAINIAQLLVFTLRVLYIIYIQHSTIKEKIYEHQCIHCICPWPTAAQDA
jgi:hypothetical protein